MFGDMRCAVVLLAGGILHARHDLKALRHALTSSFGTLCLASLVLTAVEVARSISERARRQRDNIVMCLVACVLECVYQLIEFISQ